MLSLALAGATSAAHADNPAEVFELPKVEVIGTTPLPGLGTALKDVPANVQSFGRADLLRQRPLDLSDFLERNGNSIGVSAAQGNPYQQDLNFRGFAASPLLGTPQGLSVFQDGVRINEAFGDVVNWDLLPASAIASIQLIPGSNPAFGLNTLGGALAIYTRSGAQSPGGAVEVSAGSFGRKSAEFEYGGVRDHIDYFMTGNLFDEKGWADHNPSRVKQFFGKVGYQDDNIDFDLSLTLADNNLQGTQTLPVSWLETPRQAYTFPDLNENKLTFLTAKGSRFLGEDVLLGGNAYYRRFRNTNVSSNVNDDYGAIDPDTGMPALNQATNDRSAIDQRSWGFGLQLTVLGELAGRRNQLIAGLGGDFGDTTFAQDSQRANFTIDRAAVGIGPFASETDVGTTNRYVGVYFNDTFALDCALDADLVRPVQPCPGRHQRSQRHQSRPGRHFHVFPLQSGAGDQFQSLADADRVYELQPGHSSAVSGGAHLLRCGSAMQAAEHIHRRPAAEEGRLQDPRGGCARQAGHGGAVGDRRLSHRPRR